MISLWDTAMLKKYLLNTSGNFSIMVAVGVTMLLLGVGAAIDINGVTSQNNTMQSLSDAAVLAAVTSGETDENKLKKIIAESLAVNNTGGFPLEWDLVTDGETVSINLRANYDTKLMNIFGKHELPVTVFSEAGLPEDIPINVALVLDRTGSMDGANMTALKAASAVLIDQFRDYDTDTQVAVVPFSNYVNVGLSRRNETWIDVPLDYVEPAGACKWEQPKACVRRELQTHTQTNDGVSRQVERNRCVERVNDGPQVWVCPAPKEVKWNGCIGSRDGVHNQTAAYNSKKIPGIMDVDCGEEVLELTNNLNTVKNRINSLTASENTYIPVGLINGWRMLDANQPFNAISNLEQGRKRTLILMTDGFNTLSLEDPYFDGSHDGSDAGDANALTATLCENIKRSNIDIWSVAYNFDGADTKQMLRECATHSGQFFDADNQAELIAAFENIGNALFSVRLTR